MNMINKRKREPAALQARLLEVTTLIIQEQGLQAVTINTICAKAGTSKGGFFHHFPSKEAIIETVVTEQLRKFDLALDALMQEDPVPYGRYTRAYVSISLGETQGSDVNFLLAMMTDRSIRQLCLDWLRQCDEQHKETDSDIELELIRYAADGAWMMRYFSDDNSCTSPDDNIYQRLIQATIKK